MLLSIWMSPVDALVTVPPTALPKEPFRVSISALLFSVPPVNEPL